MATSKRDLAIARLESRRAVSGARYVDLGIVVQDHRGREVLAVGGRWDTVEHRYVGDSQEHVPVALEVSEAEASELWIAWLAYHVRFRQLRAQGMDVDQALLAAWDDMEPWFTLLLYGGRRSGKSWFATLCACLYALACPGARIVVVAPKQEQTQEILDYIESVFLARAWRQYSPSNSTVTLVNGSRIELLTGRVQNMKIGKVDMAVINEAQEQDRRCYDDLKGSVFADNAGCVILSANPPRTLRGKWIQVMHDEIADGTRVAARKVFMDPDLNSTISQIGHSANREGLTELEIRREILGDMATPLGDVALSAFSSHNVLDYIPSGWRDVTPEITERFYGHAADTVIGMDFDARAGCSWSVGRFFLPDQEPIDRAALVIEAGLDGIMGREQEQASTLIAARDRYGYPLIELDSCLVVADASGRTQNAAHKHDESPSWAMIRAAGFKRIVAPDPKELRNPKRDARWAVTNDCLRNRPDLGIRCYFLSSATRVIECAKSLPMKSTFEVRAKSEYAHLTDTWSYVLWRRWGGTPTAVAKLQSAFTAVARASSDDLVKNLRPRKQF